ncbi:MAG: RNA polymerase sigma factor [Tepidibacillus sp.]
MEQDLYQIIRDAKRGKKEAFEQLVSRFKGQVIRQAYAMLGDQMEAEDVAQEAFLKAYYAFNQLESEYAFSSWLARIVANLCYDRMQKKKREKELFQEGMENRANQQINRNNNIEGIDLRMTIQDAMQQLSLEHRAVLIYRDIQGFSYDEIAEIMKIPEGTVKSRIHIARNALKKALTSQEEGV